MKIALFDFCETLANFQTADAYVRFVQSNSPVTHKVTKTVYEVLNKSHLLGIPRRMFPESSMDKKWIMRQMKGRKLEEMESLAKLYYQTKIKPNLISDVVEEMKSKQKDGYKIYLISAGYGIYLKYFAEEYKVDGVISTEIAFKDGVCLGRFEGPDCMYSHKIEYIKKGIPDMHYDEWYAYSDSITDLPMLELVGHPIVISKGKSQKWAEKRDYQQIIWQ